ncbi:hypothetical protein NIES2109_58200 (plasmid) [Nostoc sp. HK-01]|nr:hypothetical protein NIES2109_58200 [Nostoc sp. HK-01]
MQADAQEMRCWQQLAYLSTHFTGVLQWVGGISAEFFGIVREAESVLFDPLEGEVALGSRVGNHALILQINNVRRHEFDKPLPALKLNSRQEEVFYA